jgi:hypothetical protein
MAVIKNALTLKYLCQKTVKDPSYLFPGIKAVLTPFTIHENKVNLPFATSQAIATYNMARKVRTAHSSAPVKSRVFL